MYRLRVGLFSLFLILYHLSFSQESIPGKEIICPLDPSSNDYKIESPVKVSANGFSLLGAKSANIVVTYHGFTPEAQRAFQYAVDIWASLLESDVTIYVDATWASLSPNVLGSARATTYYRNFSNAPLPFVYYPVALAEKLADKNLNSPGSPDITTTFNSDFADWYFGTDGNAGGKYDFVTIVLHELGHGLGFAASGITFGSPESDWDLGGYPAMYTPFIENGSGQNILLIPNNSSELSNYLQSDDLFISTNSVETSNSGQPAKLYCPTTFNTGSSISHWDDGAFNNTENALMTHALARGESLHDPGPVTLGLLEDMGWSIPPTPVNDDISISNSSLSAATTIPGGSLDVACQHNYLGPTVNADLNDPSVGYYLSGNTTYDTDDVFLGDDLSSLGSDNPIETENETITIPSNTSPGGYYILFFGDYLDVVDEIHEFNNYSYLPITIDPIYLNVDPPNQNVSAPGGNTSFQVATNLNEFIVTDDVDWLTTSKNVGEITADYESNSTLTERTATITISGSGISDVEVTVTQEAGEPYLTISSLSEALTYEAGTINLTVDTNLPDFDVDTDESWVNTSKSGNTIEISYEENKLLTERIAAVHVSGTGVSEVEIILTQGPGPAYLTITPKNRNIGYQTGNTSFNLETNLADLTIESDANWVFINKTTTKLQITYETNDAIVERIANIAVSGEGTSAQNLKITQQASPPYLNVSANSIDIEKDIGGTYFLVDTNLPTFEVDENADWLQLSEFDDSIRIDYEANQLITEKQTTISVSGNGVATREIIITQQAGDPFLEIDPASKAVSSNAGTSQFVVQTNLPEIDVNTFSDWITVENVSDTEVEFSYQENSSLDERSAQIIISGEGVDAVQIEIDQSGAEPFLIVDPPETKVDYHSGNVVFSISTNLPSLDIGPQEDWVEFTLNNNSLTIGYQENKNTISRNTLITISHNEIASQSITLTQDGAPPYLSVSNSTVHADNQPQQKNINISTNLPDVQIENSSDWLDVQYNDNDLVISFEENKTITEREATVTLKGTGIDDVIIQVSQDAGEPFLTLSHQQLEVPKEAGIAEINVLTNLPDFEVSTDVDWIDLEVNDQKIILSYDGNPTFEIREATVVISSAGMDDQQISVVQEKETAFFNLQEDMVEVDSKGGSYEITFDTNLNDLNIETNSTWLDYEITDHAIIIQVTEQTDFETRHGELTITNANIQDQKITVMQKGAEPYFLVDVNEIYLDSEEGHFDFAIETNLADYVVDVDVDWISIEKNVDSIRLIYSKNPEPLERDALLTLSNNLIEDLVIPINQKAAVITGLENNDRFTYRIYPNPTYDKIWIDGISEQDESLNLAIQDLNGKSIIHETDLRTHDNKAEVDLQGMSPGVYFCIVTNHKSEFLYRAKIVVK